MKTSFRMWLEIIDFFLQVEKYEENVYWPPVNPQEVTKSWKRTQAHQIRGHPFQWSVLFS